MRVFRFGIVGISNTLIDFGIMNLMIFGFGVSRGVPLVLCNAVAFTAASLNSYLLNRKWTFGERGRGSSGQYLRFLTFTLCGLGVNSMVLYFAIAGSPPLAAVSSILWVNIAKVFATGASMAWNYLTYRHFVFNNDPAPTARPAVSGLDAPMRGSIRTFSK